MTSRSRLTKSSSPTTLLQTEVFDCGGCWFQGDGSYYITDTFQTYPNTFQTLKNTFQTFPIHLLDTPDFRVEYKKVGGLVGFST